MQTSQMAIDMLRASLERGDTVILRGRGDSMAPTLVDRDTLSVTAAGDLRIGDIVVLSPMPGLLVVHRVIAIMDTENGSMLQTKGDNAATPDRAVSIDCVIGKVVTAAPRSSGCGGGDTP